MKKLSFFVIVLVAMFATESAKAWQNHNHGLAAYIADQHLTPEARKKCNYYLKHTLSYYASWMDAFRGSKVYREINRSHTGKSTADGKAYDFQQGKPAGGVMGHLVSALEELSNGKYKNLPDSVVRQRLINMAHYVPDMHCPVHIHFPENIYPSQKNMNMHNKGKSVNYHGFWDGYISRDNRSKKKTYEEIAVMMDVLSEEEIKAIQKGTLEEWSLDIVEMGHRARQITPPGTDISKLTQEQKDEIFNLVTKATLYGGYRLAHILNTIFAE